MSKFLNEIRYTLIVEREKKREKKKQGKNYFSLIFQSKEMIWEQL